MSVIELMNAKVFDCSQQQTILEAARAQGITLEHSCRTGRCGICKAQVLGGVTKPLREEQSLTSAERAAGVILTCCRTAVTDVKLDVEDLGELSGIEARTLPCRIQALSMLSGDVIEVVLRTPPTSLLYYLPGQYIDVIGKNGVRRSYSIANAPRDDGKITLQVRKVPQGEMSRYWFEEAKVNDLLRLEGPLGTFCLRQTQASQLIFLATGTGIAPISAILEKLVASSAMNSYHRIHLYWGGRTEKDLYQPIEYPGLTVRYVPVLSRSPNSAVRHGYVQDAVISDGVDLQNSVVYACGSELMIEAARRKLVAAGLDSKKFHSDAFVSSN